MKTLGIMGGMGPMATVDLMRKVILATEAKTDQEHIHILVDNNTEIPDRTRAILGEEPSPVPQMLASAKRLAAQGAEVIIIGCNTAHYFLPELLPELDIPVIHMIEETAKFCAEEGYRRVGLLASSGTCASGIYQKACQAQGVELVQPRAEQQKAIQELIYQGVKAGRQDYDTSPAQQVLLDMQADGAEAFILGCTEIPVAVEMYHLQGCFVDATQVLAERAVEFVGGKCISQLPRKKRN